MLGWPLRAIDAHLQATFDLLFIALLESGVSRQSIKSRMSAATCALFVILTALVASEGRPFATGAVAACAVFATTAHTIVYVWGLGRPPKNQEEFDNVVRNNKIVGSFVLVADFPDLFMPEYRDLTDFVGTAIGVLFLARAYFMRTPTPPRKPKKSVAEPILLPETL